MLPLFLFSICLLFMRVCVCVLYVHVNGYMCVCMQAHMSVEARGQCLMSCSIALYLTFWEREALTEWINSAKLAGQWTLGIRCFPRLKLKGYRLTPWILGFTWVLAILIQVLWCCRHGTDWASLSQSWALHALEGTLGWRKAAPYVTSTGSST